MKWSRLVYCAAVMALVTFLATGDTERSDSLDDYANNVLGQQISQIPGVAQVTIGGEQKRRLRSTSPKKPE